MNHTTYIIVRDDIAGGRHYYHWSDPFNDVQWIRDYLSAIHWTRKRDAFAVARSNGGRVVLVHSREEEL